MKYQFMLCRQGFTRAQSSGKYRNPGGIWIQQLLYHWSLVGDVQSNWGGHQSNSQSHCFAAIVRVRPCSSFEIFRAPLARK